MTMNQIRDAIRKRLAKAAPSIKETPWAQAVSNVRSAWRHRSGASAARVMLQRYSHCYLVNADFMGFPGIELAEYRTCPTDDVPLVRVGVRDVVRLTRGGQEPSVIRFMEFGATLVVGDGAQPFPTATAIIESVEAEGWHILTVDDARRILEGRDMARAGAACLSTRNTWLTMVENAADRIGIAESLFPFCEQVLASRAAIIVVYTPGLPRPLRLWRLSMNWIMPPLPPVA